MESILKSIPPYVHDGYSIDFTDNVNDIMKCTRTYGFCIVDNVLSVEECKELMNKFKVVSCAFLEE